jgi:VWFA-related protein
MTHRIPVTAGLAFGLALASSADVPGQEAKNPPLTFGTEITLISIPVFVTDKEGRTVSGLTAQDFEVEDGGKPAPIQGFLAISGDGAVEIPRNAAAASTLLSSRRQFVLLFDLALSRAVNIERSRTAARKFLENQIGPRDLVSVVVATPQGMKTLLGLSPDRTQVVGAINAVGRGDVARNRDPLGIMFDAGLDSSLVVSSEAQGKDAMVADASRQQALLLMRQQRQAYAQQITQFLGGLQGLARQLDAIRGRKNIILFSEGFDTTIISGAEGNEKSQASTAVTTGALWEVDGDSYFGSATGQNALSNLFASMRGSDVVVHSIDLGSAGADTMELSSQEGSAFKSSTLDSLAVFASNTGGRFMKGVSDLGAALNDIANATRDYYVIAFSPTSSEVGKLRKLKVKVKRSGLNVNHRPAYLVPDPKKPDPMRQALQGAEIIAKGLSGGSILLSAYALPYRSPELGIGLPIVIQIPAAALGEALKRKQIALELFGYLLDDKGQVRDFFAATPSLDPAALGARLKDNGLQVLTTFAAAPGNFEVRLLVRDPESSRFGALRIPVVIPAFPTVAFVSSPMVTDDPFARVALPTVTKRHPSREIPFRINDRPFTVEADPVLKRGAAREICVFKTPSNGEARDLRVVLIGADGAEKAQTAEAIKVSRDADGFDRVVFTISTKDVEAGLYALRVSIGPTVSLTSQLRVQ